MNDFFEYLESNGVKNIKNLSGFVHKFLQDPSIFFELNEGERDGMEKKWTKPWPFLRNKLLAITKRICFNDAAPCWAAYITC